LIPSQDEDIWYHQINMFRRISHTIAVQFTAFVFLLLLLNGVIFLAADFTNAKRDSHLRLERTIRSIAEVPFRDPQSLIRLLPPPMRERIRIVDAEGEAIYTGTFFAAIPFSETEGFSDLMIENDQYSILTARILNGGEPVGYLQAADVERFQSRDLPQRALMYVLISAVISALTYLVGLFFARRSLQPAVRMVSQLEQFTQDASHELRTPLATLSSSLDLAVKSGHYKEGIESAKQDVLEISLLIERLLDLTRMDSLMLSREKFDLSDLTNQTIEKYRMVSNARSVDIEADIVAGVLLQGDPALIRQVLGNLLSNAVKFNQPNGRVHVTLIKDKLLIKDSGIGISQTELSHIFDRFYQADTSRAKEGFGLGLALVKRIVDLHGWKIDVQSEENKGTTFTVKFGSTKR